MYCPNCEQIKLYPNLSWNILYNVLWRKSPNDNERVVKSSFKPSIISRCCHKYTVLY